MDLEDEGWVSIPCDGLLEAHHDVDKKIFSRKYVRSTNILFKMDYFDSIQESQKFVDSSHEEESRSHKQLIPLSIQLDDHPIDHQEEEAKEITKHPILIEDDPMLGEDQDPIFRVFFKKENEFVEMKMGSPSPGLHKTTPPRIDTDVFRYEEKSDDYVFNMPSPTKLKGKNEKEIDLRVNNERLNIWKCGLSGIGAFCSFGMAAATICIIIFGNGQRHKQYNQMLRVDFHSDNKQGVHQANEGMPTSRGVPLAKARITYGGYYEDL